MALVSPNVPVCQALKEKIKSAIEREVGKSPNNSAMQSLIAQSYRTSRIIKKAIQMTKGRIAEWIEDPD
ncbi:hypothetical protein H5410_004470 [Solanum commersonii]|uniref:Uncharacterized protein n=1 Tax=Solanum commersonii TaxID=4109 RepID=A0A9J6B7W1_SOLCO|nr:hypothetical protein H5410_004470 [Solanum commersonii]